MLIIHFILCNSAFTIGDPTVVSSLEVLQTDEHLLHINWVISVSSQNYTQSLTIQYNSTDYTTEVGTDEQLFLFYLNSERLCVDYNITIHIETNITSCSNSRTVSMFKTGKVKNKKYKFTLFIKACIGIPPKAHSISVNKQVWQQIYNIQFQLQVNLLIYIAMVHFTEVLSLL